MDRQDIKIVLCNNTREYLGQCRVDKETNTIHLKNAVLLDITSNRQDVSGAQVIQIGFLPVSYFCEGTGNTNKMPTLNMKFDFSQVATMPFTPKKDIQDRYIHALIGIIPPSMAPSPENVVPIR